VEPLSGRDHEPALGRAREKRYARQKDIGDAGAKQHLDSDRLGLAGVRTKKEEVLQSGEAVLACPWADIVLEHVRKAEQWLWGGVGGG